MREYKYNLQLFTQPQTFDNVQVTTQTATGKDMSPTMKTFYDTTLLENAREAQVFTQFGQKQPIHGNKVEWRKFNTFAPATTALSEGVIPSGENFGMTKIDATTSQYGDYVTISDRLELEAYDDIIFGATEEMGAAGGETYDILTRNIISAGNSVARVGGKDRNQLTIADVLTPTDVNKAATWLKKNKAPRINGSYVCLIHPSVTFDLRQSDEWKEYHKYNDTAPIFKGEIGELHGVRFVESNNVKVVKGGAEGVAVYLNLFLGKDAFGVVEPDGESMEMIIKSRSDIGGPLNQFSTVGYKFCHGAKILYQERLLRYETGSSYGVVDEAN